MIKNSGDDSNKKGFKSIKDVLGKSFDFAQDRFFRDKYISREWQGYAVKLAEELNDRKHISLYMKMSREIERNVLERSRSFVKDAVVDSKAKLFMWKVGQLRLQVKNEKLATLHGRSGLKVQNSSKK